MTRTWKILVAMVPLALSAACTDASKAPAEAALAAATAAVESLKGDATRFAPEAVKAVESSYATAKDSMANKDYQGVLTFAKDVPAKAREALAKAAANKEAMTRAWTEAGAEVTKVLAAATSRLDALSQAKKLPAGLDHAALAKARTGLETLESGWAAAQQRYDSGDWSGAIGKAQELRTQGAELLRAIGVS